MCNKICKSLFEIRIRIKQLSPGQTDRQVVASGHKLNLRKHLCWVAKRTGKFPRKYSQVTKNIFLGRICSIIGSWTSLNLHWLGLCGQTVKKLFWLACKFDLDQSERKSSQVNASTRKLWPNGVASRPTFSTCVSVWPGLYPMKSPDHKEVPAVRQKKPPWTLQMQRQAIGKNLEGGREVTKSKTVRWE